MNYKNVIRYNCALIVKQWKTVTAMRWLTNYFSCITRFKTVSEEGRNNLIISKYIELTQTGKLFVTEKRLF